MTYRHSDGAGGHSYYPEVVGEPTWDAETNTLTLNFGDGEAQSFGPNEDASRIAYGRILYRDESIDAESGLPMMTEEEPDRILFNCTFWPLS